MSSPELISLPNVVRPISEYYNDQIIDLTEKLHRRDRLFVPSYNTAFNVNLLKTNDVKSAIRWAKPESQINSIGFEELSNMLMENISEGMQTLDSFNQPLDVAISGINMPSSRGFNKVVLSLSNPTVTAERLKGINIISELAEFVVRAGVINIYLGELRPSSDHENSRKFMKKAKGILSSDKFDLKQISINPGIINSCKPTSIER